MIMCFIVDKNLDSRIGFRWIYKKVLTLMLVGVANIEDVHIVGTGSALWGAVICFYLSNEAISLFENAAHLGLPVPDIHHVEALLSGNPPLFYAPTGKTSPLAT